MGGELKTNDIGAGIISAIRTGKKVDLAVLNRYFSLGVPQEEKANIAMAFEVKGDFGSAGDVYARIGMSRNAAASYEKEKTGWGYQKAAHIYLNVCSAAEVALRCARECEKINSYTHAGKIYEMLGMKEKAAASYMKTGVSAWYKTAAELYMAIGANASALRCARMCEKSKNYFVAREIYALLGMRHKVAEIYETCNQPREAARIWLELGERERALGIARKCEKIKHIFDAAAVYHLAGDYENAARIWEKAGENLGSSELREAAENHYKAGNKAKAASVYGKIGEYGTAASIYEELGMAKLAQEMRILNGEFGNAGT